MKYKSYTALVLYDNQELNQLWKLHLNFNEKVKYISEVMVKMYNGKYSEVHKEVIKSVLDNNKGETNIADYIFNEKSRSYKIPVNTPILTVDLKLNHSAFCVIATHEKNEIQIIKIRNIKSSYNILDHISRHERKIAINSSKTKIQKRGCNFKLYQHIRKMLDDSAKKLIKNLVKLSTDNNVNYVFFETLDSLMPNSYNNKFFNKRLKNFYHGKIRYYAELMFHENGMRYGELPPRATSRVCSTCSEVGITFYHIENKIKKDKYGKLFYCGGCDKIINRDFNSAINLHKLLIDTTWIKNYQVFKEAGYPKQVESDLLEKLRNKIDIHQSCSKLEV